MSRHLSVPSAAAVEQLLSYERQLEELQQEAVEVEEALGTALDAEALGVVKARIASSHSTCEIGVTQPLASQSAPLEMVVHPRGAEGRGDGGGGGRGDGGGGRRPGQGRQACQA